MHMCLLRTHANPSIPPHNHALVCGELLFSPHHTVACSFFHMTLTVYYRHISSLLHVLYVYDPVPHSRFRNGAPTFLSS